MLDRIVKITAIAAAVAVVAVAVIGGVAWAVRLDNQVGQLRTEVVQVQKNQLLILEAMQTFQDALIYHTHNEQGQAQFPMSR